MSKLTMLSLDPGKNNFAYSVSMVDSKTGLKYKVVETGMIENTVSCLVGTEAKVQGKKFLNEIRKHIRKHKVDVIVAERYMIRGVQRGGGSEMINVMIGLLMSLSLPTLFITAAQWKNQFNKIYDLNQFYKEIPLVAHRIDATLIGLYGSSFFTKTNHFDCIRNDIKKCRSQISKTNQDGYSDNKKRQRKR